jgi:large subunit ribosomal protein L11
VVARLKATVTIQLPAGAAALAPPASVALGPYGVDIAEFVKQYNAVTEAQRGSTIPAKVLVYEDRSFTFTTGTPPASELTRKAAGGSDTITAAQIREIAKVKMAALNATTKP